MQCYRKILPMDWEAFGTSIIQIHYILIFMSIRHWPLEYNDDFHRFICLVLSEKHYGEPFDKSVSCRLDAVFWFSNKGFCCPFSTFYPFLDVRHQTWNSIQEIFCGLAGVAGR